jgi:hypothetical protein
MLRPSSPGFKGKVLGKLQFPASVLNMISLKVDPMELMSKFIAYTTKKIEIVMFFGAD